MPWRTIKMARDHNDNVDLARRFLRLPRELQAEIIGWVVSAARKIDIANDDQQLGVVTSRFADHPILLEMAEAEVLKINTFALRLVHQPTASTNWIRHLCIYSNIKILGGNLDIPNKWTFNLPAANLAKLRAVPQHFPHLLTLKVIVDNLGTQLAGAAYTWKGVQRPVATSPVLRATERTFRTWIRADHVAQLSRTLPAWRRDKPVSVSLVFRHQWGTKEPCLDFEIENLDDSANVIKTFRSIVHHPRAVMKLR